jgi:hypothetical protein
MTLARVVTMIIAACTVSGAALAETPASTGFKDEFVKHRQQILIMNMDLRHDENDSAEWFDKFLRELPANRDTHSDEDWRSALAKAILNAKQGHLFFRNTGYVVQKCVIDLLIAGLSEPDRGIQERAARTLAYECYQDDIDKRSERILQILKSPPVEGGWGDRWQLYGRLRLDEVARKQLADNQKAPPEVRARVGNEEVERKLIDEFEKATDYFAKQKLARQLGYVGNKRCAAALAKGLQSEVFVHSAVDEVSIRRDVLLALGMIYQDEPLFTRDAAFLREQGDKSFDVYRTMADYQKDVNAWVLEHFGHEAWGKGPIWFSRPLNTPILRPK